MELDAAQFSVVEYGGYDAANALVLPSKRVKLPKPTPSSKRKVRILSKKQRKKLEKIVERRGKKQNRAELLLELQKHQLPKKIYDSLTPLVKIQTDGLKKMFAENANKKLNKTKSRNNLANNWGDEVKEEENDDGTVDSDSVTGSSDAGIFEDVVDDEEDSSSELEDVTTKETNKPGLAAFDNDAEDNTILDNRETVCLTRPHCHIQVKRTKEIELIRSKLPIIPEEQVIMEAITENLVTILAGETGSGKTTQIPQFLYEAGYSTASKLIGITEPRRVAAIAMANRVAKELNLSSREVSYQIRFEGNTSPQTRIKFMTDGVLLKEMENDFILSKYSVICIDEAHERSLFTDILIGLLSRVVFIRQKRKDPLKLVIMSATLRIEDFTANKALFPRTPAVIHIPTRQFQVRMHFSKKTPPNYLEAAYKKVLQIHNRLPAGGILVFVTGQEEVIQLCNQLRQVNTKVATKIFSTNKRKASVSKVMEFDLDKIRTSAVNTSNADEDIERSESEEGEEDSPTESLHVVPLYSLLPGKEQQKVFAPPPSNTRLCVVSTNVAETSLTIPSVRYVVDTGKVKLKLWDKLTGVQTFHVSWASKASAEQRAGRAGRTAPGHCYRLYSSAVFHTDFPEFSEPEIKVRPVEDMVLLMKAMSINRVRKFPYPTHPGDAQLVSAENMLLNLGAIELPRHADPKKIDATRVTSLGRTMAHLPVSPRFARMLAISFSHSVLEYVITLVAALSVKEILLECPQDPSNLQQSKSKWHQIRRKWAGSGSSLLLGDCTVLLRAVGAFEFDGGSPESCLKFGLRFKAMQEIRKLRKQLSSDINLIVNTNQEIVVNPQMTPPTAEQSNILRQILLSGFPDRIGRRINEQEVPAGEAKKYKHGYWCGELSEPVFIHSESVLLSVAPEWVVYQEAFETNGKIYLRGVTAIDPHWVLPIAANLCHIEKPNKEPPPYYDTATGTVKCYVKATYGKQNWDLPISAIEHPTSAEKYKLFAQFLLSGQVFEALQKWTRKLLSNPSIMTKAWARLQPRTQLLLQALYASQIEKKSDLLDAWKKNKECLLEEYLSWIPKELQPQVRSEWPPST